MSILYDINNCVVSISTKSFLYRRYHQNCLVSISMLMMSIRYWRYHQHGCVSILTVSCQYLWYRRNLCRYIENIDKTIYSLFSAVGMSCIRFTWRNYFLLCILCCIDRQRDFFFIVDKGEFNVDITSVWQKTAYDITSFYWAREKKWDLTQSYYKKPLYQQKIRKPMENTKNATKNFDYTTIADRLKTVCWSNNSHPTGVVKTGFKGYQPFPLIAKSSVIKSTWHDRDIVEKY